MSSASSHKYALMSRAAALIKGAVAVSSGLVTISFPTLYAKTLSYFANASMVSM